MKIEINNFKKTFHKKTILDIENLVFEENKTYCIRGRNGMGKTTLLKIIANLISADSGKILYNGGEINHEIMKNMTYLSPNPYVFNMSVYKNIYYPLSLRSEDKAKIDKVVNDYLDYFELDSIKKQNAKKCSSGEKMKIALSRAFIFKPQVLLIDEPTSNLDVESIEKLKQKITEIKKDTTIIFISHNIDFINAISDVQYVLKDKMLEVSDKHV